MSQAVSLQTGGELLAATLRAAGVGKIFAVHGGHLESFYKGCGDHQVELVDFRHESSAGHAAEAYARLTGKIGVCVVTSGPGFTNAISAMANAHLDCIPTLFIVGAPPLREMETNVLQGGLDQVAMALPTVKWAQRVTNTERIPDLTAMAIRQAMSGRRGATLIEVPIDILHMSVAADRATPAAGLHPAPRPAASDADLRVALEMLRSAARPAIICGVEAGFASCGEELTAFVEAARIPVFSTARGAGVLRSDHPLNGQMAANLASLQGEERPDVIMLLGARLGFRLGGRSGSIVPHDAKVIQIFSDAAEIGRIRDIDLPVVADSGVFVRQLLSAANSVKWPERGEWSRRVADARKALDLRYADREGPGGIHPYHAAKAAIAAAGRDPILVLDGGESASWAAFHARIDTPGSLMGLGYLGCLGTGPGQAIGAQMVCPDRRVLQVTGDGAMGFHLAEFDIMVRRKLPIMTVILNNQVWGMSIHGQQIMYGADYHAISKLGGTDYAAIASAFGCHAERVTAHDEIGPACERAWRSGLPSCIEIMIDPDVVHPVTIAALGAAPAGEGVTMIPYYENIPS